MSVQCPSGSFPYNIRSGDNFYNLSRRFNTTVEAIIAVNPGVNPNQLRVGQVICIPFTAPPISCPPGSITYVVRAGDTLYLISRRFNVPIPVIIAANPGVNPENLRIGESLCIPSTAVGICPGGTFSYTIQPGDTFYSIARRYSISLDALLAANPGVNPDRLLAGQRICVPLPPGGCPGNRFYVIKPGENIVTVAEKFIVSVNDLLRFNPGLRREDFVPGRRICIPPQEVPV